MIRLKSVILESVTIFVGGAHAEYPDLHTVMDIGFELGRSVIWPIIEKQFSPQEKERFRQSGMAYNVITPDGFDFDDPTGTLNFYIAGIPNEYVEKMLKGMKDRLDTLDIKYGPFKGPENSKRYKSLVIRIPIIDNPMEKSEKVPELNMANSSFQLVFNKILHLVGNDDWGFSFPVETIEKAIAPYVGGSDISQVKKLEPFTKPPEIRKSTPEEPELPGDEWKHEDDSVEDKIMRQLGGTHYISGYSVERLSRYIAELNNIVHWAKKRGYKKINAG